jgi:hypothetical protein
MASPNTAQKPVAPQQLTKTSTFILQVLFAAVICIYNATRWCLQKLFPAPALDTSSKLHAEWAAQTGRDLARLINERVSAEEQNRKDEIAQLRNRYESEIDALREEMGSLKSSVIALRRRL